MLAWLKADEMKALYLQPDVPSPIHTAHHKTRSFKKRDQCDACEDQEEKKGKWNTSMTKHQHCWNEDVNKGTQRMLVPCTSWWQQCGRVSSFERVNTNTINGALFFFVCVGFGPPQQWMVRCLPHRKHYNIAIPCNGKKKRWLNAPILSTLRKYDHASQLTLMSNA